MKSNAGILAIAVLVSGCFGPGGPDAPPPGREGDTASAAAPAVWAAPGAGRLNRFEHPGGFLQCVPYARAVSGIEIFGDAWTWWGQAEGRYARGQAPRVGSVLALSKSHRLRLGHVAVVVALNGPRDILVSHANWGGDAATRGKIHKRQPVRDVSPGNDWTQVRFMNTAGDFGGVYPAHGFIHQPDEDRVAAR